MPSNTYDRLKSIVELRDITEEFYSSIDADFKEFFLEFIDIQIEYLSDSHIRYRIIAKKAVSINRNINVEKLRNTPLILCRFLHELCFQEGDWQKADRCPIYSPAVTVLNHWIIACRCRPARWKYN